MQLNSPLDGETPLGSVALSGLPELINIVRQTRSAARSLGVDPRHVRGLSAAVFVVADLLVGTPGAQAEIRVARALVLRVICRRRTGSLHEARSVRAELAAASEPLLALVSAIRFEDHPDELLISLEVVVSAHTDSPDGLGRAEGLADVGLDLPVAAIAPPEALQQTVRALRAELHDTTRDIIALHTELEAQADRLRQAEDRLRLALDGLQDYAICMLTPAGEVSSWNSGAERLFGYAAGDIIGRHVASFAADAQRDACIAMEHLRRAEETGRLERECLQARRDGTTFHAHVVLAAVRGGDELLGFSLVVRDVTERTRLEEDLRRRAEDLEAANRTKEEFLATLSHELRTPLNAMLGWTRLLRMGRLDGPGTTRALDTIERNARIQEQLISDILDVSRIVTGRLRLDVRAVELVPVIDAALDAVRPAADAKQVRLMFDAGATGPVLGDADRLLQVVWNLLANAIKFTPPGGRVAIRTTLDGPSTLITVTDTGEGIPADVLPVLFDRFTMGDPSATRPHGGLGLGLSIVRHIVELHGGRVRAHSAGVGQGATFVVQLPVRAVLQTRPSGSQPLTGVRVLVVDDDADARELVSLALNQCGAETAAAASAREALQMLARFRPDVLVSDIAMPDEDGYAFIRRVRALAGESVAQVPAVALTGYTRPEDRSRALTAGFQKFVPKPVEAEELAAAVRTLVEGV